MMIRPWPRMGAFLAAAVFSLLLTSMSAVAQEKVLPPRPGARAPAVRRGDPPPRQLLGLPPAWVERLQDMSPEEQEKFLANNERFRSLPPARQAQIRQRLENWNALTPQQRQALVERERTWEQMTPEQKQYVRDTLLPQWRSMRPVRKQVILRKLRDLRDLDDSERAAKLNDQAFVKDLNPYEQQMLRDLAKLRGSDLEPPGL
jgi:hypothetical protein